MACTTDIAWVASTVADLRSEPEARAKRVSQLLLFTQCQVLEERENWWRVQGPDGYAGWIKAGQLAEGDLPQPVWKTAVPMLKVHEICSGRLVGRMTLDTRFSGEAVREGVRFRWPTGEEVLVPRAKVVPAKWSGTSQDLLTIGRRLVGIPYLWGGTSTFGFDCSGLVQRLFHFVFNFWLPRDSCDQRRVGEAVASLEELQPGDLVFFPRHVGIWAGEGTIIHASGTLGMVSMTRLEPPMDAYGKMLRNTMIQGRRLTKSDFFCYPKADLASPEAQ